MVTPVQKPTKGFKAMARNLYDPLGFKKGYNFILWFIFAGALFGFTLARFMHLDFSNNFCPASSSSRGNGAAPGECYYYVNFYQYKIGILLHLGGIIVHRISGYAALLTYTISLVGALMIARHAFGGGLDIQAWIGFVGIGVLACFIVSYINIKRLQIEQHRAWMLRGWFYAGSIITTRIIMILVTIIISKTREYYTVWSFAKIEFTLPSSSMLLLQYPTCSSYVNGSNPAQVAPVLAKLDGDTGVNAGAALNLSFGTGLWLAVVLHAIGVEIYLHLTPREAERLRKVSYQRQLEAGMRNPGSAGLTADRLGDADQWFYEEKSREDSDNTLTAVLPPTIAGEARE
ncbi:hypothetical protein BDU57DRAFT_588860 [Ampelomyces quisqualis]|uniref:Microtubule associated protein n=1 Tax=Ampelomyces quisqualis TaxID=50730 RepID=A0A6A5QGB5_AMPQU|nr:hypothetical protein BDU57DRAFT_588860 [Ampelomyces quisqualis]